MKPLASALIALFLAAQAGTAQTASQPNLVLTIFGGVATGNSLWAVDSQRVCVFNPTPDDSCSSLVDILRLSRDVTSSIIAGAGATYFRSAHVGFTLEVFYLGLPLDDTCVGVVINTDAENRNQQMCDNISAASLSTSAVGVFGGAVLRAGAAGAFSPYVRGGVGFLSYSSGTVELSGDYVAAQTLRSRALILDDSPKKGAVVPQVAAGLTARLGPGYQLRIEVRDVPVPLERVTGPANALGQATIATRTYHRIALTLGLDVVLERKRGRRY